MNLLVILVTVFFGGTLCLSVITKKSYVYMGEMFMILDRMNTKELLEAVKQSNIMDTIYRNRSC